MAAADVLHLTGVDDAARRREKAASRGQLIVARQAADAISDVTRKVLRMNELYRERLVGTRERREGLPERREGEDDRRVP